MRALLVRHGEAIDSGEGITDSDRYLTDRGRRATRDVATRIAGLGIRLTKVYTSPLVRAVQTAELLAEGMKFELAVEVWTPLAPGRGTLAKALEPLDEAEPNDVVALVGHEPLMSTYASHLLGSDRFPSFKKSGACLIRYDSEVAASFQWMLLPKNLVLIESLDDLGA